MAVGIDIDGTKHILGLWIADNEGAAFWASVCADLANRGVNDVFIVCCDGLKGLPEAVEATWPNSMVQTCIVHLIRAANRWVSYQDLKTCIQRTAAGLHRTESGRRLRRTRCLRSLGTGVARHTLWQGC